ncbi:phosphatidylglycerophosphatase A family protein [Desulfobulbus oligotrophicus]|jgi:phosphatidylglycerophosphatase A|uniref:Phosphatidylglycerophosphatase A n=1 Tax=Desulfobulbus oligotrophicus TaxID=1909699 RepID=A0A7T5VCH4_9BACT|nr:phosphatidylglycerophosphatase A [Desulfobulbus oligotrophicus]MDY0391191.1 phosphatidylglycerophosphatase A [Desulfobulbus oligotrophicus]QQG65261.1 phosphatidylglycerophosphatase A [Desulfobulbus oligotrophicus]
MDRLLMFIATGAGSGNLPKAPGTWGSLVGVLLWVPLSRLSTPSYFMIIGALFIIGVFCAGAAEKIVDQGDPSIVVIDEIVGQLIALSFIPLHPAALLAGFILFRFFDIIKPYPISWIDRHLHGGLGIMLDDVMAALYALLVLHLGLWVLHIL